MKTAKIYYHTLANGIRLVHRRVQSPVAYIGVMVGAGTRDEIEKEGGMAHFIEHTVFKGTATRTARQIIDRIEAVGGEINAYTTKEETTFYAAVPVRYVERATELLHDMVCNSRFPREEIEKEKNVIYDEIESYNDSPSELIYDDFENVLFQGHSLENPILGTPKTIRRFQSPQAWNFLRRCYRTENIVVFSQSSYTIERTIALAERYWNTTPFLSTPPVRESPSQYQSQIVEYHKHTHQTHVMLGARAYQIGHPSQMRMFLLNNILGGGSLNSRLNLSLREQNGLVYTVESTYTALSDTGYWAVYFACEPSDTDYCLELIYKELRSLREQPLSSTALRQAIMQARGQLAIAADNQENSVLTMAKQVLYTNQSLSWFDTWQKLSGITSSQLQAVANDLLAESQITTLYYK